MCEVIVTVIVAVTVTVTVPMTLVTVLTLLPDVVRASAAHSILSKSL